MDCVIQFHEVLQDAFGALDWPPIADGNIYRFHVPGDKAGTLNGWYVLFADGIASGCYGSWKVGSSNTWHSREPANLMEAEQVRQRIEQARRQREAEQHQRQQATAENAKCLWLRAYSADPDHPYLLRKAVGPYNLRQQGDVLLVPLYRGDALMNLQRIYPDGSKRFLSGGMVKGCYSILGAITPGKRLYICEGWATGVTIHTETGAAVACAMNAGNLLPVGQYLQYRHLNTELIVAGDDDRLTDGNPGRTKANKAAVALGCDLVMPPWSAIEPLELSDFNDLANWRAAQ
ncbi:toprim domain-containing protein [Pseudomonas spirodelae]|uniref:Toprim domain-containing protein n=1 Tax=Pseudomonas spirodelae TaxID=3101751 RepID=A0ABU5P5V0_9PSED|nr:toprim domain-containing protein [Pseudomonas sp. T5W1]MEA1605039.1 toprim domain-containing protein [Pseudomonas sp. T5W1]